MTQRIKLLSLIVATFCLTHCADGPNGHRIFGFGNTAQQTQQSQMGNAFTANPNAQSPMAAILRDYLNAQKGIQTEEGPKVETVDFSSQIDWNAECKNATGKALYEVDGVTRIQATDTDKDGLPDDCETALFAQKLPQYAALDPYTYNGWMLGGRYFDADNEQFNLTDDESKEWLKDKKERGGIGSGAPRDAQRVMKKFSAIKTTSMSDVYPFSEIFYNYSLGPIRVSDSFHSYERSDLFRIGAIDDENIALATGDGHESIPYHFSQPANSIAGVTGFGKDTDSYREHKKFKMIMYEGNVRIPAGLDSLEVTVGYLTKDNEFSLTPKSGAYYVINNGDSVLLKNKLLNDHGQYFEGSSFGRIYRSTGCDTAHVIIVYITSGNEKDIYTSILPELLAFRSDDTQKWSPLGQGYFSIQPQGGIACQQTFNAFDPKSNKTFFKTSLDVSKRVNNVADFNSVFSAPGTSNPYLMMDGRTNSIAEIKNALGNKPIDSMTAQELEDFEKALSLINPKALSEDDQKWLADVTKQVSDRKKSIKDEPKNDKKLKDLEDLINSPDFANNTDKINSLIDELTKGSLNADQKKKLAELIESNKNKIAAAKPVAPTDPALPVTWTTDLIDYLKVLDKDPKLKAGLTNDIAAWEKGFADQAASDAAKADAVKKLTTALLDPDNTALSTEDRKKVVDGMLEKGLIDQAKADDLKAKIDARDGFRDANGKYDPSIANYFNLVKIKNLKGEDISAFMFNSKINFPSGSSKLDKNGKNVIDIFANFVNRSKSAEKFFKVDAYTDAQGEKTDPIVNKPTSKNTKLSQARANSVKTYLTTKSQTPADHIWSVGKGVDPAHKGTFNKRKKTWSKDEDARRVEILFATEAFAK